MTKVACRSSVISNQSMHVGVLTTASHSIPTNTLFVVYTTSQGIIKAQMTRYNYQRMEFRIVGTKLWNLSNHAHPSKLHASSREPRPHDLLQIFISNEIRNCEIHVYSGITN